MTELSASKYFSSASGSIWVGGSEGAGKSSVVDALIAKDDHKNHETRRFQFDEDGLGRLRAPGQIFLLVVDVSKGIDAPARRQAAIAHTAGYRHLVVAVTKMDLVGWSETAFDASAEALTTLSRKFEFASAIAIPVAAVNDDTLECPSAKMPWYKGLGLLPFLLQLGGHDTAAAPSPSEGYLSRQFAARVACVGDEPLLPGRDYNLKLGSQVSTASISSIKFGLNPETLHREPKRCLEPGDIGVCIMSTATTLAVGAIADLPATGRFVLTHRYSGAVVAAGTVDFALRRGTNIHVQSLTVSKALRASTKKQRPCVVWFTGLSGSGKSTIANALERELVARGLHTYLLDGDNLRHGLNKDLGFTAADRVENIRRVGEVAKLFVDAGLIVLCSFISPFRAERAAVRALVEAEEFVEVHVNTPLAVCETRDSKGLYGKARAGKLPNFTGIDSPYEVPEQPDMAVDMTGAAPERAAGSIIALLRERGIVPDSL